MTRNHVVWHQRTANTSDLYQRTSLLKHVTRLFLTADSITLLAWRRDFCFDSSSLRWIEMLSLTIPDTRDDMNSSHAHERAEKANAESAFLKVHTCCQWNLWHTGTVQFQGHICPCCDKGTPQHSLVQTFPLDIALCRLHPVDKRGKNALKKQKETDALLETWSKTPAVYATA